MSIPLVQKPEKDDINTSIIAIKRNIERINMLLGLVDSGSDPDLSGLATKQELQDAVTELTPVDEVTSGNMHSVTSNAVARAISFSETEQECGEYFRGVKKYHKSYVLHHFTITGGSPQQLVYNFEIPLEKIISIFGFAVNATDYLSDSHLGIYAHKYSDRTDLGLYARMGSGAFSIVFDVQYIK